MHTQVSPDPTMGATPSRRPRLRVMGAALAALLLLGLAQPPASAHGRLLSSTTAPGSGIVLPLSEAPMLIRAARTDPSPVAADSAPPAVRSSETATSGHHTAVAGIPTPLAVAVGAVILVLAILLAVTALTRRHRHSDDDLARKAELWRDEDPFS